MNVGLAELTEPEVLGMDDYGGPHDAVRNNLYGAMTITSEALRAWNMSKCLPVLNRSCPKLGYRAPQLCTLHPNKA